MLASKLFSSIGNTDRLYVDDVFSAYTYTGNGSTQTINNGIDLAGKGGLVWIKRRSSVVPENNGSHWLFDTQRGASSISSDRIDPPFQWRWTGLSGYGANGFSVGSNTVFNESAATYASWTFRKAPKFFDVVTWTGNATNRTIAHALGQEVGLIFVKRTNTSSDWQVYHRSLANTEYMVLNSTAAKATGATRWNSTTPTTSVFSLGTDSSVNASGDTYIAYLFAHDPSADGIIQCGSVTGTGAVSVELGWEPQFVLIKAPSNSSGGWHIFDTSRGMTVDNTLTGGTGNDKRLSANSSTAEASNSSIEPTATGFRYIESGSPQTFIYLAIRRPNKPPTTGTQVYNAVARTGTGSGYVEVTGAGFAPDMVVGMGRGSAFGTAWYDRLRGKELALRSALTNAEVAVLSGGEGTLSMDGVKVETSSGILNSAGTYINWFFKRAPGFFDVVCYTGDGSFSHIGHSLGVQPEIVIFKARTAGGPSDWRTTSNKVIGAFNTGCLNVSNGFSSNLTNYNSNFTTTTTVKVLDTASTAYVAYLFASLPGISKVGSYTGNGSSQTINCGFSTGARFILIKRTDSTGDWYVWDTARGIIAANDPHLSLNTAATEVATNDSVDPDSTGFIVNQVAATNINVNGATYIFLSIA